MRGFLLLGVLCLLDSAAAAVKYGGYKGSYFTADGEKKTFEGGYRIREKPDWRQSREEKSKKKSWKKNVSKPFEALSSQRSKIEPKPLFDYEYNPSVVPLQSVIDVDLDYIDMDEKIFGESGVFTRFLGTELEKEVDGQIVKYKFPLPVVKTENSLQRQILPPDMVLRDFSNLTIAFQEKILGQKGIPVMNGKFLAIFMWDNNWGTMQIDLSSITKGSRIEQKEAFVGRGFEVLDGSDIESTVTNGAVFADGTWRMDVSFLTGQNFSYWGKAKTGWLLEGCFTCLGCAFTASQCLGRVFLMPDQLSMEQATGTFVSNALQKIALPENDEPKDEKALKKYKKHLMKLEKILNQMGSKTNPKGTSRSKKFNAGASDLFFNEDFDIETFYEKLKMFIKERFGAKERHYKRQWTKVMMKIMAVCEFDDKNRCPAELRKFESKDQIRLMTARL